ncbi:hypothetical protein C2869_16110 [Saccharobesus litoralis]|uniref:Uncharacterized protein n=1 Tax=Saccharobesus litoralis TaxID=2172099 RepID=A0A2S0VUF7_9ALTE|nr:hypothetical protein [Saccharobesus litoralis]AWB67856.1 hypothetical protein C2869_16110 [Saccharobesus litoralis]
MDILQTGLAAQSLASVFNADVNSVVRKPPEPDPQRQPQPELGSQTEQNPANKQSELTGQELLDSRQAAKQQLDALNTNSQINTQNQQNFQSPQSPQIENTNRSAISAYSAVQNQTKREEIQGLLGVDTYV